MSIQELGSLGEFLAALATIATLIYLARQLSINTRATQANNRHEITRDYARFTEQLNDVELSRAWSEGLQNYPDMKDEDDRLFGNLFTCQALMFQGVFAQYDNCQLDEVTYLAYLNFFSSLAATPGGSYWWESSGRPIFVPTMVAAVDNHIAKGDYPELPPVFGTGFIGRGA